MDPSHFYPQGHLCNQSYKHTHIHVFHAEKKYNIHATTNVIKERGTLLVIFPGVGWNWNYGGSSMNLDRLCEIFFLCKTYRYGLGMSFFAGINIATALRHSIPSHHSPAVKWTLWLSQRKAENRCLYPQNYIYSLFSVISYVRICLNNI